MTKAERKAFARRAAGEGIVLIKNKDKTLPIRSTDMVAIFGVHSFKPIKMGWGSGDIISKNAIGLYDALIAQGVQIEPSSAELGNAWVEEHAEEYNLINRRWGKWTIRFNEIETPSCIIGEASKSTNTAIVTVGRCAGEAWDFRDIPGEYRLADDEISLIERVSEAFDKVILIMNTAVPLDITAIDDCKIDAILFTALCGEEYANAVTDVILGKVNPSARLATTWAYNYSDHPTKEGFGTLETKYTEGIYVGYRYFDTFKVPVRARFGEGLSYTSFKIAEKNAMLLGSTVSFEVTVENVGEYDGKDVIQCYISAPDGKLEKAYRELAAYKKTSIIEAGAKETVNISFDIRDFASYDEERASYILEAGKYVVSITDGMCELKPIFSINVMNEIITKKLSNRCTLNKKLDLLKKQGKDCAKMSADGLPSYDLDTKIETEIAPEPTENKPLVPRTDFGRTITLKDVKQGTATVEDVVAQFSIDELADAINGTLFNKKEFFSTVGGSSIFRCIGAAGQLWKSEKYGFTAGVCADGPSGIRLGIFDVDPSFDTELAKIMVCYPSGSCLANTWNEDLLQEFGRTVSTEMDEATIEGWLAPGINIQRNPLCGRNFEYCSEDPLVAGNTAVAITNGVQYNDDMSLTGRYTTVKHYACNNVEYERRENDSIVSERALREIFLRGFEIAVKKSQPHAMMSSYNKVNGTHAATNYDLCEAILRTEWGYKGMVMTDWGNSATPNDHYHAGNDLAMPGYYKSTVLEGIKSGEIRLADAQKAAVRVLTLILKTTMLDK